MAVTAEEYAFWLSQERVRIVTVAMNVYDVALATQVAWKFANLAYVDSVGYVWDDCILSMGDFSRTVGAPLDPAAVSYSFGDIELLNDTGRLEGFVRSISQGYALTIKIGDPAWAIADFKTLFEGECAGVTVPHPARVLIKLKERATWGDKVQKSLYTTGDAVGKYKPWAAGTCTNVEPVLIDSATQTYEASQQDLVSIADVKDGGLSMITPLMTVTKGDTDRFHVADTATQTGHCLGAGVRVRFTDTIASWPVVAGTDYYVVFTGMSAAESVNEFKIAATPGGAPIARGAEDAFTTTVRGYYWYETAVAGGVSGTFSLVYSALGKVTADIVAQTTAGTTRLRDCLKQALIKAGWSAGDIDFANIDGSGAVTCNQAGGIFLRGGEPVEAEVQEVAASLGVIFFLNRAGKIAARRFEHPDTANTEHTLTADDLVDGSVISFNKLVPAAEQVVFGVARNFTPMDAVFDAVTPAAARLLREEYATRSYATGAPLNHIYLPERPLVRSLLTTGAEADTETARELALYDRTRAIFVASCYADPFAWELGDVVKVKYDGVTLDATTGRNGIVLGISENYLSGRSTVQLFMGLQL